MNTPNKQFSCSKCNNNQCETGEFYASGGMWSKVFNIQARKFQTVSCTQCGFTEIYQKEKAGTGANVLDFLVG